MSGLRVGVRGRAIFAGLGKKLVRTSGTSECAQCRSLLRKANVIKGKLKKVLEELKP